jgi:hypothetical protein
MNAQRPADRLRRLTLALLLPLLMLLAQQGAAWHALGHLGIPAPSSSQLSSGLSSGQPHAPSDDDESQAQHSLCLSCLAFTGVDGGSAPLAWADALLEFGHAWVASELARPRASDAPRANSRGPPQDF